MSQQGDQSDLISVAMVLCRDLCDMAHVLSRLTMMPTPNDNLHKQAIKGAIDSLYKNVMMSRAQLLALGDIANFDTSEIQPGINVPNEIREKIDLMTGFIRGENDLDEETKEEMRESLDASIDDIDMPEKDKKEAKDSVSDLINRLANRRKSGEGSDDDA
tara:strand:+ start:13593 stop:14072 length:480 start_codon:yes stop_codon:yes gene_type:complete